MLKDRSGGNMFLVVLVILRTYHRILAYITDAVSRAAASIPRTKPDFVMLEQELALFRAGIVSVYLARRTIIREFTQYPDTSTTARDFLIRTKKLGILTSGDVLHILSPNKTYYLMDVDKREL